MIHCDVFVVGGGPAGAACAWMLRRAGLDVVVADRQTFPRDKVCAGWITPQVIEELRIDGQEYGRTRTFQPFTGFRVGVVGRSASVATRYAAPVSFGIRRCEFDEYLLRRSGARLLFNTPIMSVRRETAGWIVNDAIRAAALVGAGGHFCPIARMLNAPIDGAPLVAAQELEVPAADLDDGASPVDPEVPELYFTPEMDGYGWCIRKGAYLNIGFGTLDRRDVPRARSAFVDFLRATRRIVADRPLPWRGHAYLLAGYPRRAVVADGVMLVGDAAGLAAPQSGEGIRPAIESGLLAARTIADAAGDYRTPRLASYADAIARRFASPLPLVSKVPASIRSASGRTLLRVPWFVRRIVLDRWFLHADQPALAAA